MTDSQSCDTIVKLSQGQTSEHWKLNNRERKNTQIPINSVKSEKIWQSQEKTEKLQCQ